MARQQFLDILKQGVAQWNRWRSENSTGYHPEGLRPMLYEVDLSGADLRGQDLRGANFWWTNLDMSNLHGADLSGADLRHANLRLVSFQSGKLVGANLHKAYVRWAHFLRTNLRDADLSEADFTGANFRQADMTGTNLRGSVLRQAMFLETNLENAELSDCEVYGVSAWDLKLSGAAQHNLTISRFARAHNSYDPRITVDDLEVAQFIYMLLGNTKLRQVIDTVTAKVVLILGRFSPERKLVLERVRDAIRNHGLIPVLFDFDRPSSRDSIETVSTLAHMSRFVIADLTQAKSVLQELQHIVPNLPSLPVQPLLERTHEEPGMFDHLRQFPSVLTPHRYDTVDELIASIEKSVIQPAQRAYERLHTSQPQG